MAESVTRKHTLVYEPAVVGVPPKTPVAERVMPGGALVNPLHARPAPEPLEMVDEPENNVPTVATAGGQEAERGVEMDSEQHVTRNAPTLSVTLIHMLGEPGAAVTVPDTTPPVDTLNVAGRVEFAVNVYGATPPVALKVMGLIAKPMEATRTVDEGQLSVGLAVMVIVQQEEAATLAASVAARQTDPLKAPVGVPERRPVEILSVSPPGSELLVDQTSPGAPMRALAPAFVTCH